MKVFLDINLLMDVLYNRIKTGYAKEMVLIFQMINANQLNAFCASSSFFTLDYFLSKTYGKSDTVKYHHYLLNFVEPVPTTKTNIIMGLNSKIEDKEDAFQLYTAMNENEISYFLTGNVKDFKASINPKIPVLTPKDFLEKLAS